MRSATIAEVGLRALTAVVFAACSFNAPGNPGSDAGDGTDDSDGDGIIDRDDNCPTVENADQFNEDGDDFGNECDQCPTFDDGSMQQNDDDGDGIGNGCDPQEGQINSYVFFEGFDVAIDAEVWANEDDWVQDIEAGLLRRDNNDQRVYFTRRDTGGDDNIVVVAGMDFDDENTGGLNFRFGGVFSESSTSGQTHRGCWLVRTSNNIEIFGYVRTASGSPTMPQGVLRPAVENERYEFSHTVVGTNHSCRVVDDNGETSEVANSGADRTEDDVGVVASFMTANLYYIYAIRLL